MKLSYAPKRIWAALTGVLTLALALTALLGSASLGVAATVAIPFNQQRISFQIATGSTAGTFFPVGEAIAGLISHPRGVDRCESANVCGPPGLIMTARTSDGAVDNLIAVNRGDVESGLAQSDVIAAAVKGAGPFRKLGSQDHVRVIASLFAEDVHLIVAARSKIKSVADLRGKRVSLGSDGSGVGITAGEVLAAYRIPQTAMKARHEDMFNSITLMKAGKLDAFFAVGAVPLDAINDLVSHGQARLAPIDGPGRMRLLKMAPSFSQAVIPAGGYSGRGAVETVSMRALWVVRDSEPDALIYGITQALFNPRNHDALASSHPAAGEIGLATASLAPPAPLHPGAARFYAQATHR
jgi:TRAP transporter TAXI family solute receptor